MTVVPSAVPDDLVDHWERSAVVPPLLAGFRSAVRASCDAMAGQRVGVLRDDRWSGGPDFTAIGVPDDGFDRVTVDEVQPDLDTVTWDWAETLDGGTLVGTVEVEAAVSFSGYLSGQHEPGDGVTVVPSAWIGNPCWACLSRPAVLRWQVTVDPGQSPEMEFDGASAPPGPTVCRTAAGFRRLDVVPEA